MSLFSILYREIRMTPFFKGPNEWEAGRFPMFPDASEKRERGSPDERGWMVSLS